MKAKNSNTTAVTIPIILTNDALKHSFVVVSIIVEEIVSKIIKQLPPDPEILLQYSGILIKNTTQKLVDVTILNSQNPYCLSDQSSIFLNQTEQPAEELLEQSIPKQKNTQFETENNEKNLKIGKQPSKPCFRHFKIKKTLKINEDQQVHIKKDGIKILKRQQLKNLIHYRNSNSYNSIHQQFNNLIKSRNKIETKNSIHQNLYRSANQQISQYQNNNQNPFNNQNSKNAKTLENLPGIQNSNSFSKIDHEKQRNSGVFNNTQFVNLKDYYKGKGETNSNLIRNTNYTVNGNFTYTKFQSRNHSITINQNSFKDPIFQLQKQAKKADEIDAMINKLRQRKQKFYRTGMNYSNGESLANTKRENTLIMSQSQKGSSPNQVGAMVTFDYSGQIMSTFKYDAIKMQPHYQEMEFTVGQNDEYQIKKKQRRGHMFRAAPNLKLVDHQKVIPQPQNKYEPLVEKVGMLMKQNTAYNLKKGVEFKAREDNINGQNIVPPQSEQNRERLNRAAFEFLYNNELGPSKIKYQDFIRYKKSSHSITSMNKNPSSRKKLFDQKEDSILTKKSIAFKGLKGKQSKQDDTNNKIYKSQNSKALELLVNLTQNNKICELVQGKQNFDEEKDKQNNVSNGIFNKKGNLAQNSSFQNGLNQNNQKKKVRIA